MDDDAFYQRFSNIFRRRVEAVVYTIKTSGAHPDLIKQFDMMHETLLYIAPETISAFNGEFGALCFANQEEFIRLGIDLSIRDIMKGKRDFT
jgi:hypothetical protein